MDIKIRPIKIEDAEGINALRIMDGVRENILGITSERIDRSKNFISNLNNNAHMYVAEIIENEESKIIGTIGLHVSENPRLRHCGSIGIMVHKDYQGKGIGKKLMSTVIDLSDNWLMLKRLELGAERVFEVIDEEKEKDKEGAKSITNIDGHVELKNVTFSYEKGKEILKNVSIEAKKGEVIAIVGPTGAGKTTIVNLLTKFYKIDSGEILIDGKNIDDITRESLRKSVAMVLQDTYLFSESVSENIRYGRLEATEEEIIEAAKIADAHHFIKQLPEGYNTILADNGCNLSQGQRQLLAIARAILSKASILILDEATSSIDTRTEVLIQNAMLKLMQGKTTFVIAHRLSTIRNADKILALKDGEIIESGTHDELLEKNGFYASLYNSQFKNGTEI